MGSGDPDSAAGIWLGRGTFISTSTPFLPPSLFLSPLSLPLPLPLPFPLLPFLLFLSLQHMYIQCYVYVYTLYSNLMALSPFRTQVPRSLWNASRRTHTLNHCYFKAAKLCTDMSEADEKLSEAAEVWKQLGHVSSLRQCFLTFFLSLSLCSVLFSEPTHDGTVGGRHAICAYWADNTQAHVVQ